MTSHNVNKLFCVVCHTAGRELESRAKRVIWGDDASDSPAMRSGRPGLPSCQTVVEEARAKGEFTGGVRVSASEFDPEHLMRKPVRSVRRFERLCLMRTPVRRTLVL